MNSNGLKDRSTRGRACGKVILFGEHAVVYGVPAIALGLQRGAHATATPADAGRVLRIEQADRSLLVIDDSSEGDLSLAFRAVVDTAPGCWLVDAVAEIPAGAGLGCSAALGVAIVRALHPSASIARVCDLAMEWERVFHGNPSGVDAAVSARGGCVLFERSKPITPVRVGSELTLCVGNTGVASSTRAMVETVARMRERKTALVDKSFDGIRSLVANARGAIESGDQRALGRLMDLNQMILSGLFISTPEIEHMCGLARAAGAVGAKLTGAGGGGCVVALASEETATPILRAWDDAGFSGFVTRLERSIEIPVDAMPKVMP